MDKHHSVHFIQLPVKTHTPRLFGLREYLAPARFNIPNWYNVQSAMLTITDEEFEGDVFVTFISYIYLKIWFRYHVV